MELSRDKISLAFILARSLNLVCAGALAEIKFHARTRCFGKDTAAKPCRDYLRGADSEPHRRNS